MISSSSHNEDIPVHVAVIMDGNGRWAQKRGLPRLEGHRKGAEAVRRCIEAAKEAGVKHLTLFAFSSENWNRPQDEVSGLMDLMRYYLKRETAELKKTGVRLEVIGELDRLDEDLKPMIDQAKNVTAENNDMVVTVALSYGGRRDIVLAAQELAHRVKSGELDVDNIDENSLSNSLMTAGTPDPDLIIRTSGEQRLSNFLMWQSAYSEIYFTDTLWPDFDKDSFAQALEYYAGRDRRFGVLPAEVKEN